MMTVKQLKKYLSDKADIAIVKFSFQSIEIVYPPPKELLEQSERKRVKR